MLLPENGEVNRLGIFFFYDGQGVVDDYIPTMLKGFEPHFSDLTIVVNGKLNEEGRSKLSAFSDKIIVRENKGLDVWAYKTALDSYGWEALAAFDEIVLFNATIMGPVYPFSEMFTAMGDKDLDFWGITKFHKVDGDPFGYSPYGYLPEHIQSHFHAYRKSFHTSEAFRHYWDNLPEIKDYMQSVGLHESVFTKRFADKGFKWGVYVDTADMEGFSYGPVTFAAKDLIEKKRMPIFKRRSFFHPYSDVMTQSAGTAALDLYEYLRDHTDFDTDLIWQNALRSMNLADLQKNLHLDYVLSDTQPVPLPEGKTYALVMHLYYPDLVDQSLKYAYSMPEGSDLILTVGSQELIDLLREKTANMPYNVDIRKIENRGRDVSAFLIGGGKSLMKYDYVAFMHDKKVTQLSPQTKGDGFRIKCFDNMLASKAYVSQVIHLFEENPRMGMAMPTGPNHAEYFPGFTFSWGPNFAGTKKFMKDTLGMSVPMDESKEVVAPLGTMFWFRPAALHGLLDRDWNYADFPPEPNGIDGTMLHFVERAYGYVPQANGFYPAYIFSEHFARVEITNLEYMTRELTRAVSHPWIRPDLYQTTMAIYGAKSFRGHARMILMLNLKRMAKAIPGVRGVARRLYVWLKRVKKK
ncbi:rhamnan synthesis protein F [Alloscardovia macacae]|uniref:Rhamnan synthesis protein F n=1 Tax=Alloscardovia macacae TaxID=1160091 RepID=A0A1Y2SWP2_9BIFI|nr:rhamnan synthesis F family protein [Alloscardovia macacae]OTA26731.1 rhamnan synthesis protein F [Alloscardovia macacae]OTA29597.1 rhamnan synthesis protein F [Alloscardovia macacae]